MDPDAALRMIDEADRVDAETRDVMRKLHEWLSRGGFAPAWDDYPTGTRRYRRMYGGGTTRGHATKRRPSSSRRVVGYFVYANGEYEGETKTLGGARRMAAKVARIGMRPEVRAAVVEGDRSWNEPVALEFPALVGTRSHATRSHATSSTATGSLEVGDIVQRSDIDGKNRYVVVNIASPWIYTRRISGSGGPGVVTFPSAYMLRKVA